MDRHALVIYDTRYGNTMQIAEALAKGISEVPGIVASCHNAAEVHGEDLEMAELLVIGGPTEYFGASHHIREFFGRIGAFDLHGKLGFAFDTHAATPLAGAASRLIEKDLRRLGVVLLEPRHSAITRATSEPGAGGSHLEVAPEALAEFQRIGHHLGEELLEALRRRPERETEPVD